MALSSGLSRLCNTGMLALRKEPNSLPGLGAGVLSSRQLGPDSSSPARRGHHCPVLGVPGTVLFLPTGNGGSHGVLALPAEWAAPRISHLLGAPWRGLPAHPSKIKHCLNSQHPPLRDRSPGPTEFQSFPPWEAQARACIVCARLSSQPLLKHILLPAMGNAFLQRSTKTAGRNCLRGLLAAMGVTRQDTLSILIDMAPTHCPPTTQSCSS